MEMCFLHRAQRNKYKTAFRGAVDKPLEGEEYPEPLSREHRAVV